MAEEDQVSGSIDDFLIDLAQSVQQAQQELSRLPVVGPDGRPAFYYQIPKLEFEFKIAIEVDPSALIESGEGDTRRRRVMKARPVSAPMVDDKSAANFAAAASTIRGALIAVPLAGGKPPLRITTFAKKQSVRVVDFTVVVMSALDESQPGISVEFNIDRELSRDHEDKSFMNPERARSDQLSDTQFDNGVVLTNDEGIAANTLRIGKDVQVGARLVVMVDAAGKTERFDYIVEN